MTWMAVDRYKHHSMVIVRFPTLVRVFTSNGEPFDEYCPFCYRDPHPGKDCPERTEAREKGIG